VGLASTDHWEPKTHFSQFKMMDVNETDMGMCVDSSCMRIVEAYDKIFKSGRIDHIEVFTMVQLKV